MTVDFQKFLESKVTITSLGHVWTAGESSDNFASYTKFITKGTKTRDKRLTKENDFNEAIYLDLDGKVSVFKGYLRFDANQPVAIGSGKDYALAAIYLGKTAAEAVLVASALDIQTNSFVECCDVKERRLFQMTPFPEFPTT